MKHTTLKVFALLSLLALLFPFLFSCTSSGAPLVGRWEIEIRDEELGNFSMVYHFSEDGEIYLEQKTGDAVPFSIFFGTWSVKKDQVTIQGDGKKDVFYFSVSENTLTLSRKGEEDLIFRKV